VANECINGKEIINECLRTSYTRIYFNRVRYDRIQDCITRNPTFSFTNPRYLGAYTEAAFPYLFFVDGRNQNEQLDIEVFRSFFQDFRMPPGFHRRNGAVSFREALGYVAGLFAEFPTHPGNNQGASNFIPDSQDPGLDGVRPSPDCNSTQLTKFMLRNTLVMLSLHQTRKCHRSCSVSQSIRITANGSEGKHRNILSWRIQSGHAL